MESVGFRTEYQIKTYPWLFDTEEILIDFCKNLFNLDLASDDVILEGIKEFLNPFYDDNLNKFVIQWSLIYFISTKSQDPFQS